MPSEMSWAIAARNASASPASMALMARLMAVVQLLPLDTRPKTTRMYGPNWSQSVSISCVSVFCGCAAVENVKWKS